MSEKNKPQPPVSQPSDNLWDIDDNSSMSNGNTGLPGDVSFENRDTFVMQSQPRRPIGGGSGDGSGENNGGSSNNR